MTALRPPELGLTLLEGSILVFLAPMTVDNSEVNRLNSLMTYHLQPRVTGG